MVIGGTLLVLLLSFIVWDRLHVGRELDRYHGVPVYDNGLFFFRSYGRHYGGEGYYYGQKWQCVEYIKRFYYVAKGHSMPDVWGHARDFFDPNVITGTLNQRRGLLQYTNGSHVKPEPDDLLVFRDTAYGHVGIITSVTEEQVVMIQQNMFGKTRQVFQLNLQEGRYYIREPRVAAGWLRLTESLKNSESGENAL